MKSISLTLILFVLTTALKSQIVFDEFFYAKTLRFDFIQGGNADTTIIYFEKLKEEPFWGGPRKNLISKFEQGNYRLEMFDLKTNKLIFSYHFNNLFLEWQTTAEAKYLNRSYYETVIMPYPKNSVRIEIHIRNKKNEFRKYFEYVIDPNNYFIEEESVPALKTAKIVDKGESADKVDIVFIPEGYTEKEMKKFEKDAERFAGYLLKCAPFSEHTDKFNIWRVDAPSLASGPDVPGENIWKKTAVNSTFYTFDIDRYLTTKDIKSIRDIAACVPYDQIYIIVNSSTYGGGGIYNHYSMSTSDHELSDFVMVHEFGHGFCGLADEYYSSEVAYENYYELSVEPIEPNITTLVDFNKKWKNMLAENTPVPTPATENYKATLGVFEGGGYMAKGVYRPMHDCTMKSTIYNGFCPVCQKAIVDMILYLSDK